MAWRSNVSLGDECGMPTHPRKHSVDTQIIAEILKEAAEPRQSASVKEAVEKVNRASVAPKPLGGSKGGKTA